MAVASGLVQASEVEDEDATAPGGGGVGADFEEEGIVANRQVVSGNLTMMAT